MHETPVSSLFISYLVESATVVPREAYKDGPAGLLLDPGQELGLQSLQLFCIHHLVLIQRNRLGNLCSTFL